MPPVGSGVPREFNGRPQLPKGRAVFRTRRTDRVLKTVIRGEADSLLEGLGRSIQLAEPER